MSLLERIPAISSAAVGGKRLLVRADLNVPLRDGAVADATRIERFAPGARVLLERGAALTVMTHLGRPKGKPDPQYALAPVAAELAGALGLEPPLPVIAADGEAAGGSCVLLENLRFHPGEEADDPEFARRLARHGDLYVNDAFSCSHRKHASVHAVAGLLPSYGGDSLLEEVKALERCLDDPERPVMAIVGGAKIDTKIGVLERLVSQVQSLAVGGAMANTFLAEAGHDVGKSLWEEERVDVAREVRRKAEESGCALMLPDDVVVAREFREGAESRVAGCGEVGADEMILDVGPETVARIARALRQSRTLLWNGPLGAFETEPFGEGTFALAREVAQLARDGTLTAVTGGGDTAAALAMAGATEDMTYVSTAGGAFLEWVEGRPLPGIEALVRDGSPRAEGERQVA